MNPIQHMVLSGGGAIGLKHIGILQELHCQHVWSFENLVSIYGTSVGAIVGAMVCLKHDWSTLVDYVVDRPWSAVFKIGVDRILTMVQRKGIFGVGDVETIMAPLLKAQDLTPTITLSEFYAHTHVDLHIFAFDVNTFSITDISHGTHGDLPLVKAVAMSCALPGLFSPVFLNNSSSDTITAMNDMSNPPPKCFIDGGFSCNYPLDSCMARADATADNILGLRKTGGQTNQSSAAPITEDTSLIEHIAQFSANVLQHIAQSSAPQPTIDWEINIVDDIDGMNLGTLRRSIDDRAFRADVVKDGRRLAISVVTDRLLCTSEKEEEHE
jgi:predicted acylesterase/phospholipase RssA